MSDCAPARGYAFRREGLQCGRSSWPSLGVFPIDRRRCTGSLGRADKGSGRLSQATRPTSSSRPQNSVWRGVLRQNLVRAENGLIPGGNDLHTTRELNQKVFLIAYILCSSTR